jgi:hypothetical protein
MPVYINQVNGKLVTRIVNGSETIQVATANAVAGESVSELHISKIFWSGNTTIARGDSNNFVLTGNGEWPLDAFGIANSENPTSNVVITTDGTVIVELKKQP